MFKFVFNQGIAEIRSQDDSETIIAQPFRPSFSGPVPWANEEEAQQWIMETFPQFFQTSDSEEQTE